MRIVFLIVGLVTSLSLSAQHTQAALSAREIWQAGLPHIDQYTSEDYRAHVQNWCIVQDDRGIIYVGNTSGILEFDGVSWRLITLPNGSPAKSFAKGPDNTIYVGGVRDFGYLKPDSLSRMEFHSLLPQLDSVHHNFADIWFTYAIDDAIYFISDNYIFKWDKKRFKVWDTEEGFGFASRVGDRIYIDEKGKGLMRIQKDSLVLIPDGEKFANRKGSVTIMLPYEDDKILMGHFYDGLFLYDHHTIQPLREEDNALEAMNIYSGLALPDGRFVFTTHGQGCFVVDRNGKVLQWHTRKSGLISNVIIGCYADRGGNLWLATESGINRLAISSPLRLFGRAQGLAEGTDRAIFYDGKLFAATKSGLFQLNETSPDSERKEFRFEQIKGIDYQTWDVTVANGYLLAGTFSGLYQVDHTLTAAPLLPDNTSDLCPSLYDTNRIYTGTMTGKLFALKFANHRWQAEDHNVVVEGRIMKLEEDPDGSIWISTRYNGVYKLVWSPANTNRSLHGGYQIEHFTTADGLPAISYNVVQRVNNKIYFSTRAGIYRYDTGTQTFHPDTGPTPVSSSFEQLMKASSDGGIWITGGSDFDSKVFKVEEGTGREVTALRRFPGFSVIDIYESDQVVFFSGISGIIGFDQQKQIEHQPGFPACIRKVQINNDSLIFGGAPLMQANEVLSLPFQSNSIRFVFALPGYSDNRYQYFLEGFGNQWSSWSTETQRDFTNLPEGDYSFQVRARNVYGQVSKEGVFAFTVLPPWYRAWWAYSLYFLTGFLVISLIGRWRSRRLRQEKTALELVVKDRTRLLETQAAQLKEMDEMKSRFFANISHEFRTPLTLIKGPVSELLKTGNQTLQVSDAEMIDRNADRLIRLVNQLLDLSKLDSGNLQLDPQAGEVNHFLRSLASAFCSHAEQRTMIYRIVIPDDRYYASFDCDKIEKIVYNLLSNAFKFTPDKGVVTFASKHEHNQLKLTISDNGWGIPSSHLHRIFDRFYQVDSAVTRGQEGTGIGLTLTRELVHLMGGTISVNSTPGTGSTFTVMLPMPQIGLRGKGVNVPSPGADRFERSTVVPPTDTSPSDEVPVVLIVEDNADMRDFIKGQLARQYRVIQAAHGQSGLEIASREIPDLVITDLMMPGMDGLEFCQQLKTDERTSHIPVIMLTARAGQEQKLEGLKTRADDYLTKPFDREELEVRIENLILQRKQLHERFSREVTLEPGKVSIISMDEKFIHKIKDEIDRNLSDPAFGAAHLQNTLAMSKTQLYRKMKALTNHSPGEFIRNYRLKRAAQILANKGDNVTQVAYEVGFNNLSYFARCFKELHGVIPSEYHKTSR